MALPVPHMVATFLYQGRWLVHWAFTCVLDLARWYMAKTPRGDLVMTHLTLDLVLDDWASLDEVRNLKRISLMLEMQSISDPLRFFTLPLKNLEQLAYY